MKGELRMKIGIIGAMDSETGALVHALTEKYGEQKSHRFISNAEFNEFETESGGIVVCTCGCGKVNGAIAATLLIYTYSCDNVVNIGCCGTMSKDVKVSDFVIPDDAMQYDCDTTELGEPRYMIQGSSSVTKYHLSEKLRRALIKAADACGKDIVDNMYFLAASGDTFIGSKKQQKYFGLNKIKPHVVDMETAAIAHACWVAGVEFASIRRVSDGCDATVYADNKDETSVELYDVVLEFLKTYTNCNENKEVNSEES